MRLLLIHLFALSSLLAGCDRDSGAQRQGGANEGKAAQSAADGRANEGKAIGSATR
jgi:hypothetical protein